MEFNTRSGLDMDRLSRTMDARYSLSQLLVREVGSMVEMTDSEEFWSIKESGKGMKVQSRHDKQCVDQCFILFMRKSLVKGQIMSLLKDNLTLQQPKH